ncbi:hypothetical protein [Sinobaca sp. H24]|uniref:hypothetical protein n=1 Tax=Sinobaca sp. H24 TaxID=2923376 RepID=UPI00207AC408|nr:hypothetical protein [Sinobaca sp. H24]
MSGVKNRTVLLASIDRALEFAGFQRELGGLIDSGDEDFRYVEAEPYTAKEAYEAEKEATGLYLSGHPLDEYSHFLPSYQPAELGNIKEGLKKIWVAGIEEECREIRTKREKKWHSYDNGRRCFGRSSNISFVYRKVSR